MSKDMIGRLSEVMGVAINTGGDGRKIDAASSAIKPAHLRNVGDGVSTMLGVLGGFVYDPTSPSTWNGRK